MVRWAVGGLVVLLGVAGAASAAETDFVLSAVPSKVGAGLGIVASATSPRLPDGAQIVFRVFRSGAAEGENPLIERRGETRGTTAREELADTRGELVPGDYRVTASVAELPFQRAEIRRLITPPLRRLTAEVPVTVGNRAAVTAAVNRLARLIMGQADAIGKMYPGLASMLARAWKKDLSKSEWKQSGLAPALEKGGETLRSLLAANAAGSYLPLSAGRAQSLLGEVRGICTSIEDLLNGREDRNDNLVKTIDSDAPAPAGGAAPASFNSPAIKDLHATLFREGCGAYAAVADLIVREIDAAYAARAGKGAGNWEALAARWSREIGDQVKNLEEFDALAWPVEKGDRKVLLLEIFAMTKDLADFCGRLVRESAPADAADLDRRRGEIRTRIASFK
jgi:hypothetical protein